MTRSVDPCKRESRVKPGTRGDIMTKLIAVLLIAAMVVHIIKPLGLPGLKKRMDFWKIIVVAFVLTGLIAVLRP